MTAFKNWTKIVVGSTLIAAALFVGPVAAVAFCFCGTVQIVTAGIDIMGGETNG